MRVIKLSISLFFIFTINSFLISQVQQEWVSRYTPILTINDYAKSVVVDGAGNVYVTGYGPNGMTGIDYKTIKYNSAGVQQWVQAFNGTGNSSDYASSIALDNSGNVYVTGNSYGSGTDYDYATIKYNSDGVFQWVQRYDGTGHSNDESSTLTTDGSGNVYVSGGSTGIGTAWDLTTIKYSSSGVQQWVQRYDGPAHNSDHAYAIKADGSGNVYVTGYGSGNGTAWDYTTIKYNSSGVQQWIQIYNGSDNWNDVATSMQIDNSANVYITGISTGIGTSYDYATIKYNSAGVQQWVQRYNGPANSDDEASTLAIDGSGNVYVTGLSTGNGTSWDYTTIKYNSSGVQQWLQRYNGPGNTSDYAYSIATDGSGNVFVTGYSTGNGTTWDFTTIKYNTSGVQQWVQSYNGSANDKDCGYSIATDASGNVYAAGYSSGNGTGVDYTTIKYNSSGVQQWLQIYNGSVFNDDEALAISADTNGNVYITGYSFNAESGYDYATIKYNSDGVQQWLRIYNGTGNSTDAVSSEAIDVSGNVYVTGSSTGNGTGTDYVTIKYNSSGVPQWIQRYNGPGNSSDGATSIVLDGSGNVYVTGSSTGIGTSTDYATIKYNSSGVQQWVQSYNGTGNNSDAGSSIAVDGSGNVYVTGSSTGNGTNYDYATIKYNYAGAQLWAQRYNGPGNSWDNAYSIAVDASGNVYVTGRSTGNGTDYDYATIKYNSTGVQQWVQRYNGPGNLQDAANSIAVDGSGNVYVTGSINVNGADYDCATIKYNSSGVQQWVQRYNGSGNDYDGGNSLVLDNSGNIYVTGEGSMTGASYDYLTIKYNSAGTQQWVQTYNGPANEYDNAKSIAVNSAGNVYVTGSSSGNGTGMDYATIKYNQQIGIKPISEIIPHDFMLYQNYPNPFNPTTKIKFDLPKKTEVKFFVYDILGREKTYINYGELNAGTYEFEWSGNLQSSGVYFYKITARQTGSSTGDFNEIKRMIVLK